MNKINTFIVTKENGIRPAGVQDKCFYCNQPLSQEHTYECLCKKRTVLIEAKILLVREEPISWDTEQIEFHLNEGSWCQGNLIQELLKIEVQKGCLCGSVKFSMIREATEEDEKQYKVSNAEE